MGKVLDKSSEAGPKYAFPVPDNFEGFIDHEVSRYPEKQRRDLGRIIAFAFTVGFDRLGFDPNWQPPQKSIEIEQSAS